VSAPAIATQACSKWYGQVLGISDLTWSVTEGVVGLLGPNGAGKSTLMKLMTGLIRPSRGTIQIYGEPPHKSAGARRRIGYCPEHEGVYNDLTALEFVTFMAELSGVPGAKSRDAAAEAMAQMGMTKAQDRRLKGFSKGMRQRTKLASTIVHDPDVIVLDEPLTGVDPLARMAITDMIREFGKSGRIVVVSSHVLHEIEALTSEITLIHRGQILAEGNIYGIRSLIDKHPHRIEVECDRPRDLGSRLSATDHVQRLTFTDDKVVVETRDPDSCYDLIADVVLESDIVVQSLHSPDNNLSAVFEYLTSGRQI